MVQGDFDSKPDAEAGPDSSPRRRSFSERLIGALKLDAQRILVDPFEKARTQDLMNRDSAANDPSDER